MHTTICFRNKSTNHNDSDRASGSERVWYYATIPECAGAYHSSFKVSTGLAEAAWKDLKLTVNPPIRMAAIPELIKTSNPSSVL